ncbi:uncharacterized protein LOC6726691 [Drosophila simulans]|uniref:GD19679 n=1 Tax=Drosophila simulans TaxID=7240 RepID=B4QVI0_DROSI|nr:uncharacterized protein LOC6726691 [Drosophila simulans]EDX11605.1 GD19679 [Drosophila simulans]KMZ01442.1 uncharacterized protein Dsimw501_GD19679 [Drosophila simulans]
MDSQMLNVFQEDTFEGNYTKYESEPNFWSSNDELQLTDTLSGILPIAPTDESLLNHDREEDLQNRKNLMIYNDFVKHDLSDHDANELNAQVYRVIAESEVEVAYEQQRQISAIMEYDQEDIKLDGLTEEEDIQSQSTFRTRTDSSSIGDYESHSSDYDDEYDIVNEEKSPRLPVVHNNIANSQSSCELLRKGRTLSTNTIISEVDALGLNIDVNNFDLADFITKDDFAENLNACRIKESLQAQAQIKSNTLAEVPILLNPPVATIVGKHVVPSSKPGDSDYDSDSIIDVETVDMMDMNMANIWPIDKKAKVGQTPDELRYVDNVKADPSWSPRSAKKATSTIKENKPEQLGTHQLAVPALSKPKHTNICLVPNKKQCDFLKRKVGASSKPTKATTKKVTESMSNKQPSVKNTQCTGLGLGGKNLSLLKQERDAAVSACAVPACAVSACAPKPVAPPAHPTTTPTLAPPAKRKLNLEEYKQRRCGGVGAVNYKPTPPKQAKVEVATKRIAPAPVSKPTPSPKKAEIVNIVNSLKCPQAEQSALPMDPITMAKNKVLRMLEMKRAQQLKIIDSRVSAKVPRVTKLPPLKDIVKDTYCMETEDPSKEIAPLSNKLHPDYEEIIIVSASCNTDITIPPNQLSKASPRSLLKSSVLLYNISNGQDANKNMSNSLIASIQSEVVRQTSNTTLSAIQSNATKDMSSADKNCQHGEDMVIMHLPKDRVRKTLVSIATQTDLQPEFPLLTLPPKRQSRERTRRNYRKRRTQGSGSNMSTSSSDFSSDCSSVVSHRSRSRYDSTDQLRNSDVAATCGGGSIGNGGYSSRSTQRHRSSVSSSSYSENGQYRRRQRRTSYNKRRSRNQKRGSTSSSCSGSEKSDRERSRSPHRKLRHSRSRSRSKSDTRYPNNNSSSNNNNRRGFFDRNVSQPAVEERRIVYVGRIEQETTKEILRRKFLPYGSIKQITIHYKENGMKYGFVTYERAQDAFTAIDTSHRDSQINMYDISFGGRRAFCRSSYADLDNAGINNYNSYVFPNEAPAPKVADDSFEALLLKVKAKLNAGKSTVEAPAATDAVPQGHSQM